MATFPGGIYSPRTKENKAGVIYDANKKTIGYAEDVIYLDDEVVAIETELGTNPKGAKADVKTRLDDVDTAIAAKMTNPMTTAEDIIKGGGGGAPARLGVGDNGKILGVTAGVLGYIDPPPAARKTIFLRAHELYPLAPAVFDDVPNGGEVIKSPDGSIQYIHGYFYFHPIFSGFTKVSIVWFSPAAAGNLYMNELRGQAAASGEAYNTHQSGDLATTAPTGGANKINVSQLNAGMFTNISAGDYVGIKMGMYRNHANDTLNADVFIIGLLIEFT